MTIIFIKHDVELETVSNQAKVDSNGEAISNDAESNNENIKLDNENIEEGTNNNDVTEYEDANALSEDPDNETCVDN